MNTQTQHKGIEWTRVNNDGNGNPRYVCHYLNFLSDLDFCHPKDMTEEEYEEYKSGMQSTNFAYKLACRRANKIGGRKFHNKQYGGGIVFKSYNINATEKAIHDLLSTIK